MRETILLLLSLLCTRAYCDLFPINVPLYLPLPLGICRPPIVNVETILPAATIDWPSVTISGFSSGGVMAAQYVVAHSAEVKGAGILAGWTYGQFFTNRSDAPALKMTLSLLVGGNALTPLESVPDLETQARAFAAEGLIDGLSNLTGTKVFIYSGLADVVINNVHGHRGAQFFTYFGADVATDLNHVVNHLVITDNFPPIRAPSCVLNPLQILYGGVDNCGYELIFNMFKHLYGVNYVPPVSSSAAPTGTLYAFDQTSLTVSGNNDLDFMDNVGYLYIPNRCRMVGNTCKIHIALHGCNINTYNDLVCNFYATKAGYFQVADANDVVVVFPQAADVDINPLTGQSNIGCWDYAGGVSDDFCLKTGLQLASIRKIAAKIANVP